MTAPPTTRPTTRPLDRHPLADALCGELAAETLPPGQWPEPGSVPVSILVPVKNEESNLPDCLRLLRWAGQVVVVDSHTSADRTVPISQAFGAEVYDFRYSASGWPKKKNWALDSVQWKHDWVLVVDADERVTPELAHEVERILRHPTADAYFLKRRFYFMGRWIRHCGYYPVWNLRLFRHAQGRYERIGSLGDTASGDNEIHEHVVVPTRRFDFLKHDLIHYAYPDLSTWVEKHNRYSNWEAHAMVAGYAGGVKPALFGDPVARRRWLKVRSRWLPGRPLWRFLYSYLFQGGFLDGVAGYYLCWMLAWYEFLSIAKFRELKNQARQSESSS
ncbi:MAG: glycosyltransferase family 2 protein [Gemmataceae bacterium]|nr:glycosyltransferase family 2 protein [Gemmataceae bacterium]